MPDRVCSAGWHRAGWTVLALLACVAPAHAQTLNDGLDALEKKFREHKTLIGALLKGEVPLDPAQAVHTEAVDTAAKYVVYPYVLDILEGSPGAIEAIFRKRLEADLSFIQRNRPRTDELAKEYGKRVRAHALEVANFASAKPIARVNAARTLARLAELAQPELADTLVELLNDSKQGGGVHFYALRGLRDLLALPPQDDVPVVDKARVARVAESLVAFLNQKPPLDERIASREEIDGYRYLRREAIRALAQTRLPAVNNNVLPALVLARVAGNDQRLWPAPRLDERLEASIGLARMRPVKEGPTYQPDYAVWQIGLFLEAWGNAANQNRDTRGQLRLRPWKVDAARLAEVLLPLKAEVKVPYVARGVDVANRVLNAVSKGDLALASDLSWYGGNPPPSKELFAGVADSTVVPGPPEPYLLSPDKQPAVKEKAEK
jgi:hypothetical protein